MINDWTVNSGEIPRITDPVPVDAPVSPAMTERATCLACLPHINHLSRQVTELTAERYRMASTIDDLHIRNASHKSQAAIATERRDKLENDNQQLRRQLDDVKTHNESADAAEETAKLRSELATVTAERDRLAQAAKEGDDKKAKLEAAKARAVEARKAARKPLVMVTSFVFYLVCVTGALYGLVDVFHGLFAWLLIIAVPLAIALELSGIKFKMDANDQLDAGEDATVAERISKTVAVVIVVINFAGHVAMGAMADTLTGSIMMFGQAIAFSMMSYLGYLSWSQRSSFLRRLAMRAEGRVDATHLRFTRDHERQYGKKAVEEARQLAAADIAGELTVHDALQKGAEAVAAADAAAEEANRKRRLIELVRSMKRKEYPGNPELAEIAVARMRYDLLASNLMADDDEHDDMTKSIMDQLVKGSSRWKPELGRVLGRNSDETGTRTGTKSGRKLGQNPDGNWDETGTKTGPKNGTETGTKNTVPPAETPSSDEPVSGPKSGTDSVPKINLAPAPKTKVNGCPNAKASRAIGKHIAETGEKPSTTDISRRFGVPKSTAGNWITAVYNHMTTTDK